MRDTVAYPAIPKVKFERYVAFLQQIGTSRKTSNSYEGSDERNSSI